MPGASVHSACLHAHALMQPLFRVRTHVCINTPTYNACSMDTCKQLYTHARTCMSEFACVPFKTMILKLYPFIGFGEMSPQCGSLACYAEK